MCAVNRQNLPLTGKQKRFLRAKGSLLDPIVQVGKDGVNEGVLGQVDEALEARELIKIKVLNNSPVDVSEVAADIAGGTGAEIAQTLGHTILLYRLSTKKPQIELP